MGRELSTELQKELAQMQIEFFGGQPIGTIAVISTMGEMIMNLQERIIEKQTKDHFLSKEIARIVKARQSCFN
jgi:hypothetical protein